MICQPAVPILMALLPARVMWGIVVMAYYAVVGQGNLLSILTKNNLTGVCTFLLFFFLFIYFFFSRDFAKQ